MVCTKYLCCRYLVVLTVWSCCCVLLINACELFLVQAAFGVRTIFGVHRFGRARPESRPQPHLYKPPSATSPSLSFFLSRGLMNE